MIIAWDNYYIVPVVNLNSVLQYQCENLNLDLTLGVVDPDDKTDGGT